MRVVQFITQLKPAGAERVLLDLSVGLQGRGDDVEVVSLMPLPGSSPIVQSLRDANIPVHSLEVTKRSPWRVFRLRRTLRQLSPDIVHAHLFHATIASRLNGFGRSYRLVNTVHLAEHRLGKMWLLVLDRVTLSLCDRQTVVSRAVQSFHARRLGVAPDRMPVIYNGIRPPAPVSPGQKQELHQAWGVAHCHRVIGCAGRLDPQKGFDMLLRSLPALAPGIPDGERWAVVILGEGPQRGTLERIAADLPPQITVSLPGFRDDAAWAIGAFDVFVMPSRFEGFGISLIEAMAHGLPVLFNPVDSLPEIAASYPQARSCRFTRGELGNVASALADLTRLQSPGPPMFKFPIEAMIDGYLNLYEKLLANGSA